jgi:16S rRNA (cytosine1407-C5)-methyltransferase
LKEVSNEIFGYLKNLWGENSAKKYIEFISAEPSQYIRVNGIKTTADKLNANLFNEYGIKTEPCSGVPECLQVVSGNEILGKTIEHINGFYYIQSFSSMIPAAVLNPSPEETVLDLCSAPGSKTTQLSEMMNNRGTLVANEVQLDRIKMLVFNIDRMNALNIGVIHYKGEWLSRIYHDYFDKILVDAPCSGLGIIQKKSEVSDWWSLKRTEGLAELQMKLLVGAIKMLKVGGEIVYSTCTITVEENELLINKILKKYPVQLEEFELRIKYDAGFTSYSGEKLNPELSKTKRILPWEVNSEGFFIAKFRKIGSTDHPGAEKLKATPLKFSYWDSRELRTFLIQIKDDFGINTDVFERYKFLIKGNDIFFITRDWNDANLGLFERIGIKFGKVDKRRKIVLHTNAAQVLHNHIPKNIYEIKNQAELKNYLEGATIKAGTNLSHGLNGQCVIKYQDLILGTGLITNGGIKSRYPRSKRTQSIYF